MRKRRKVISQLKGADGLWCSDLAVLEDWVVDYYRRLYTSEGCSDDADMRGDFLALSHADKRWLNRDVSDEEIRVALFQMGPDKAAGPDGFLPRFFQKFWGLVGPSVCTYIHGIFTTRQFTVADNKSMICLLPKVSHPEILAHFRLIALCNTLSKLVMKVLANRLKPLMLKLTGCQQASFIPGQQAVDNVVIAQEVIHTLRRKKGRAGGLVLKVDLEKAYDRVEWPFVRHVILAAGFSPHLAGLIQSCVSSTSLTVLWNGKRLPEFQPQRGLRQGDPFSSYLF